MPSKFKRKNTGESFVKLDRWLLQSGAYQDLSVYAQALYPRVVERYDGFNNGWIAFSARDAANKLNCSHSKASESFKELLDHGFIEISKMSGFNMKGRVANEYRLTAYKCDKSQQPASKSFMSWKQSDPIIRKSTVRGANAQVRVANAIPKNREKKHA